LVGTPGRDVIAALRGDDVVDGRGGEDLICGGRGRDLLRGGGGRDRLLGGRRGDLLNGGPGDDELVGGPAQDRVSYVHSPRRVVATLGEGFARGWGHDTLASVEGLVGSRFDDTLIESIVSNGLVGGPGDDEIRGAGGGDG